jgi:hemerythrin-like domain-containing protein
MNAIELLKQDHQEAMTLIEELEIADEDTDEEETLDVQTFSRLQSALKLHTRMEEEVFYPALEQFGETRDLVQEAYREHEQVDELLAQLSILKPTEESFQELLSELRDSIEHHVEEEEGEMFPKAEELCGPERLNELGRQMEQIKQNTASRKVASGKPR